MPLNKGQPDRGQPDLSFCYSWNQQPAGKEISPIINPYLIVLLGIYNTETKVLARNNV
jgi:hypothetical protein